MRVGILCAGDREVAPFLPFIQGRKESRKAMLTFVEGQLGGVDVVALYTGVCKVNATIAAQILIDTYGVDAIINAGTAGGMYPGVKLLDCVIADRAAYHDVAPDLLTEFHPWMENVYFDADPQLLSLSRKAVSKLGKSGRVHWGLMATGEAFITEEGREQINRQLAPLSVDMETAAVAHVCYVNKVKCAVLRTISDGGNDDAKMDFPAFCKKASDVSSEIMKRFVRDYND